MLLSDSWWVQRLKRHILQAEQVVNLQAPVELGGPYLLDALRGQLPAMVWFEIKDREKNDLVLQTNKLIAAFNKTMGQKIIDHGVTPPYILTVLQRHDTIFDRCVFVLSGSEHAPELIETLRGTIRLGHRFVVMGEADVPESIQIDQKILRLTKEEAHQLVTEHFQLAPECSKQVLQHSQGNFERFWVECHRLKGLSVPHRPAADGKQWPAGHERIIEPAVLISLYLKKQRYLEALEMAVESVPEQVMDVLDIAASQAILQGEHQQLLRVLEKLPEEALNHEEVWRWRLEAAYLGGKHMALKPQVLAYLEQHEAPDLRALAANLWFFGTGDLFYQQAQRAVQAKRSTLSIQALAKAYRWQMQHLHELKHYVDLSFEALQLAEEQNDLLQIIGPRPPSLCVADEWPIARGSALGQLDPAFPGTSACGQCGGPSDGHQWLVLHAHAQ